MSLDVSQLPSMGSEVSVLAAWREISLGKRGGSLVRRLTQESRNRKKLLGMPQRNISPVPVSDLFCKKIDEVFSI